MGVSKFKDAPPGNCYGYIRVSAQDQADHGVSLAAQERQLQEHYERVEKPKGYETFRMFREAGVSAYKRKMPERPEGSKLLAIAKAGDLILFSRLDRAFRNLSDGEMTLKYLANKGVRVVMLDMAGVPFDSTTAAGFIQLGMMLTIAQFESMTKSERNKRACEQNIKERGWSGWPPPGIVVYQSHGIRRMALDVPLIEASERGLSILWDKGPDALCEAFRSGEIAFRRMKGERISIEVRLKDKMYLMNYAMTVMIRCLWVTDRLEPLAARHGMRVADFFSLEKRKYLHPYTGKWQRMTLPRKPHKEILDGLKPLPQGTAERLRRQRHGSYLGAFRLGKRV